MSTSSEGRPGGIVLLKLGGSLISDKRRPETPRPDRLARLAAEIAASLPEAEEGLLLGHGSGSYGHVAASRHGLRSGRAAPVGGLAVAEVQAKAAALHRLVLDALRTAGVPAFSVAPSAAAVCAGGRPADFQAEPVALALEARLVPVVHGDVVLDREGGATILSTETVLVQVALRLVERGWRVRRALWAGETEGVYGAGGEPLAEISPGGRAAALEAAGGSPGTDVTGGMAHRVEVALELAERGIPSWIGSGTVPDRLRDALRGRPVPGTRVVPGAR